MKRPKEKKPSIETLRSKKNGAPKQARIEGGATYSSAGPDSGPPTENSVFSSQKREQKAVAAKAASEEIKDAADRSPEKIDPPAGTAADAPEVEIWTPDDNWLLRNGHSLTYAGIFLFTLVLYFRPYELIPALAGFQSIALVIAVATLLIFVPSQLSAEGNLTAMPIEVKCILFMTAWAILTIPLAKSPALAWATFNDTFIRVVIMFIVMVNTLRTEARIKGLMWLGIGVGIMLSWQALDLYQRGVFKADGYRVAVDFGGMFGNPNDMAVHLVIFIPLAVALGAASKSIFLRYFLYASAAMMTAGSFVTQSRGAFLGLVAVAAVFVWKFGRRQRLKAMLIASVVGVAAMIVAPGNYGLRILSIFIPSLDPVGSSDQRTELLIRSIVVTLRNPLGIGIGNFQIVGTQNLGTHNAFTQVSSELGWLAFIAYMILILSPVRKLDLMERQLFAESDFNWLYYLSVGIQASIAGFFVASFFSSVAYHWYVYYPIAYAIGLRRIYQLRLEGDTVSKDNAGAAALRTATA
ncbi:MAG: O-antigen ligase family protein [Pyrinomonadaceae bacterium]